MDMVSEILRLRKLHERIVEADLERRRYRHLMNEFVHSGRILFRDSSLVYRDVHSRIFDSCAMLYLMKKEEKNA